MKKVTCFLMVCLALSNLLVAQVGINNDSSLPHPSAGLDVKFTNKGFLPPRMTQTQRDAIVSPAEGLIVICTDCGYPDPAVLSIYLNGAWRIFGGYCATPISPAAGTHTATLTGIAWNWDSVSGASGYKWGTTNNIASAMDMGTATTNTDTGLTCNTAYIRYVWAYNECGLSSSTTLSNSTQACWACGDSITDSRDGKKYGTVAIGSQCLLRQNLNIGTRINGSQDQAGNGIMEKYCYNDQESNCNIYGGLYQWSELMQYVIIEGAQGLCMPGWHIPTDAEWTILTNYLGGDSEAGGKLKEAGTNHWATPNTGATNSSGFTGLPGGTLNIDNNFADLTNSAYFWSSSPQDDSHPWDRKLDYQFQGVFRQSSLKNEGFSARCFRDTCISNTTSDAGPNQFNVPGTSAILAANAPGVGETGTWNIFSGSGGSLINPSDPATTFNGIASETYQLVWTITNACHTSADSMMVSFAPVGQPCPGVPSFDYGGQTYNTVQIGYQCWMKENLNIGDVIDSHLDAADNGIIEKYCYDNDPDNCAIYGGLYQWNEMMGYTTASILQGICPQGWHLPATDEWTMLTNFLGGAGIAGGKMKEAGYAHWYSPNVGATNSSGFTALPGGLRAPDGGFYNYTYYTFFWSSSQQVNYSGYAWCRSLYFNIQEVWNDDVYKTDGFSVRCLKDDCISNTTSNAGPDQLNVPASTATLAANAPGPGETGAWSIISGSGGGLVNPNDPATTLNGIAGETYQLTWTISNFCHISTDAVTITFSNVINCGTATVYYGGQTYHTVEIGTQCWMKENLNIGDFHWVTDIPWNNGVIEKYCYNNDQANCAIYGGLYQWDEMMGYTTTPGTQGICPQGWHLPADGEWTVLTNFLGGTGIAGGNMKETGYAHWQSPNTGATNSSGFTALPGGARPVSPGFTFLTTLAYFWSSSQDDAASAWGRKLNNISGSMGSNPYNKSCGFSARCLKD
jgi:uncharacterized protein (TIGR02145 family)